MSSSFLSFNAPKTTKALTKTQIDEEKKRGREITGQIEREKKKKEKRKLGNN